VCDVNILLVALHAVDLMLKGRTGKFDASNLHLSTLHSDVEYLEKSIRRLHGILGLVFDMLCSVLDPIRD
jgi:hypothetical protein